MATQEQEVLSRELRERSDGLVVLESALMIVINFMAFAGNVMVCWAVYRNLRLRTIPNIYVVTLAISDALMAVLCMPMSTVLLVTGHSPFSGTVCHFQGFFCFFCALYSLLLMTATAVKPIFPRGETESLSSSLQSEVDFSFSHCDCTCRRFGRRAFLTNSMGYIYRSLRESHLLHGLRNPTD